MAGATLWQPEVRFAWQAQHFVDVALRFRGRRGTLAAVANRSGMDAQAVTSRFRGRGGIFATWGTDFVAGAALSRCGVQISWQGQQFCNVGYRFRGRGSISQHEVQISWQGQHFRNVRYRFRGYRIRNRGSTFAT